MGTTDSKAILAGDLHRMRTTSIPDDDSSVYDHLFELPTSVWDLFSIIQPDDVRHIKGYQPRNLGKLLHHAIRSIQNFVEASEDKPQPAKDQSKALNAVRVLTRILPILLEESGDSFSNALFWRNKLPPHRQSTEAQQAAIRAAIAAGSAPDASPAPVPAVTVTSDEPLHPEELVIDPEVPLGTQLIHSIMFLLFTQGFTIDSAQFDLWHDQVDRQKLATEAAAAEAGKSPAHGDAEIKSPQPEATPATETEDESDTADSVDENEDQEEELLAGDPLTTSVWSSLLWTPGVSFPEITPKKNSSFNTNRVEVLRLLLVCLSEGMYVDPDPSNPHRNPWSDAAVSSNCPLAPTLFYCLLNAGLAYDPIGWGVPYGSSWVSDFDEPLADMSLQVLAALLDYAPFVNRRAAGLSPTATSADEADDEAENARSDGETSQGQRLTLFNIYRSMLHSLSDKPDLEYVVVAIARLLSNVHESQNTYLPGSTKQISCYQEILVLLWKLLDENHDFLNVLLNHEKLLPLTVSLLYMMWSGRLDPARVGLVHICTFILLLLSGNRLFCVALNAPFNTKLPADLPLFHGNHVDLAVIVLHKLTVNGSSKLSPLYNCFLTIISNLSPYAKTMCMVASVKIINLFELYSSPKFLFARPDNHVFVEHLLDTINNIVQYQYEGNPHLVYALVRRRKVVEALAKLKVTQPGTAPDGDAVSTTGSEGKPDGDHGVEPEGKAQTGTSIAPADNAATQEARRAHEDRVEHGGFVPTAEWLASWKGKLQLGTVMRLIDVLGPQVEAFVSKTDGVPDEEVVMSFIRKTTMVGALPVPHAIITRRYQPNHYTALWFTTFLWGVIFLRNQQVPVFDSEKIKLFTVTVVG